MRNRIIAGWKWRLNVPHRCLHCGHRLAANDQHCSDCGAPLPLRITIHDPEQFHLAQAALERDGLLVGSIPPGGPIGVLGMALGGPTGWLMVDGAQLGRVENVLDDMGIVSSLVSRPIVDRTEPECPACAAVLDSNGPEVCPRCGAAFQWVQVDVSCDYTGVLCSHCGYELTGLRDGNCPECGNPLPGWPTGEAPRPPAPRDHRLSNERTARQSQPAVKAGRVLLFITMCVPIFGVITSLYVLAVPWRIVLLAGAVSLVILLVMARFILLGGAPRMLK